MANPETDTRLKAIRRALGDRNLVWFGTRGTDALPLFQLRVPRLVASQIAPISPDLLRGAAQECLETMRFQRKDLDGYDIDVDIQRSASGLKQRLLDGLDERDVLVTYRPAEFLSATFFCRHTSLAASNFHLGQRQFEYKPWVESQLILFDPQLPILRWTYIRKSDTDSVRRALERGSAVGRTTTGSGGVGVFLFSTIEEFEENKPQHRDHFVGVAPYLETATPLNVNACVYDCGKVAVFGVSLQLIGLNGLTKRRFGFCGNDFQAAADVPGEVLDSIERSTGIVGNWLGTRGFRGAFGIDFLVEGDVALITEVNARFQASTPISSHINQAAGMPDPICEHVAAFLAIEPPPMPSVREQVEAAVAPGRNTSVAHVIHRNIRDADVRVRVDQAQVPAAVELESVPAQGIMVEPEGMLFKSLHTRAVTRSGRAISAEVMATRDAVTTTY